MRDRAKASSIDVPIDLPCSVRDVIKITVSALPELSGLVDPDEAGRAYAVAMNRKYVDADQPCLAASELALIPPVSGG